jgi:nucleotide-binding universal stress UspA family protein
MAASGRARLTVLFVNDPLLVSAAAAAYDTRGLAASTDVELRRFVTTALPAAAARRVRYATAVGKPGREIVQLAATSGADLIVMGTHGMGTARRWFFGSVTDYVLRHTPIPLLAVPPAAPGRRARTVGGQGR